MCIGIKNLATHIKTMSLSFTCVITVLIRNIWVFHSSIVLRVCGSGGIIPLRRLTNYLL